MNDDNRKFKGVWIPAELWLDQRLSITEKVMLVEIDSLESEDRGCYRQNAAFAKFFGLSISRVSEIISGLAEKGLVTIEQIREGNRVIERRIRMVHPFEKPNTPPSEKAMNPFGKGDEPPSEKAKESNTRRGNTKSNSIKTSLPEDFAISERVREWASEKGNGRLEERFEHFVGVARANGYRYIDWDQAFMNAVRDDWAKLGAGATRNRPSQGDEATRRLAW
ncbi:hypothetical protein [Paraburkholderia azotifigens]|uniref:hypothetical protein n=1 Tax=Paraburkholderia azotifigens TaxID=2057004 RepID=UPI0038BB8104